METATAVPQMAMVIPRSALMRALACVGPAVGKVRPDPRECCVRVVAESDGAWIVAGGDALTIRYELAGADVSQDGEAMVAAEPLGRFVAAVSDAHLTLAMSREVCEVRGVDSRLRLDALAPDGPAGPGGLDGVADVTLPAATLRRLIGLTVHAVASDSTRCAIAGVLLELPEDDATALHLVATDGRRLVIARGAVTATGPRDRVRVIVPAGAMRVAHGLLEHDRGTAEMRIADKRFVLRVGRVAMAAPLVDGNFPNYRDVIPGGEAIEVELRTADLTAAVRRVAALAELADEPVARLTFADDELTLTATVRREAEITETVPVSWNGDDLVIGIKPAYLRDALAGLTAATVTMELRKPENAVVLRDGSGWTCVIMRVSLA